ncbi:MAG: membrane protein insertion efficiency factor YidD [Thermoguttaceae bacterium]|nr:membrane protein insertion efficiency factor YidD [Thermoguttaceae bacterium]
MSRLLRLLSDTLAEILIWPVRFYQAAISPMLGPKCRYTPTCSEYFVLAVRKYGPIRGSLKGVWRILRCNPFSHGGTDYP